MNLLFYDTETSGLPLWDRPSDDPAQPHIASVAMLLTSETGVNRGGANLLITPEGWTMPAEMEAINGLTQSILEQFGVSWSIAADLFRAYANTAGLVIGHNIAFDQRMMRIEHKRRHGEYEYEWIAKLPTFCTQLAATDILKIPPTSKMMAAGFKRFKTPSLAECVQHFFGRSHEGGHTAMGDVIATRAVYFEIVKRTMPPPTVASDRSADALRGAGDRQPQLG